MKNFSLIFLIVLLFSSCAKEENSMIVQEEDPQEDPIDDEQNNDKSLLLTIKRGPSTNYNASVEVLEDPWIKAIVTGEDGEILDEKVISVNSETKFEAVYDEDKPYLLHVVTRVKLGTDDIFTVPRINYFVSSFINVENDVYTFNLYPTYNQDPTQVPVKFNLTGEDEPLKLIYTSGSFVKYQHPSSVSENYIEGSIRKNSPGHFIVYGKKENEPTSRYLIEENLEGPFEGDYVFSELPFTTEYIMKLPKLHSHTVSFNSYKNDMPYGNLSLFIDEHPYEASFDFPKDYFNKYHIWMASDNDNANDGRFINSYLDSFPYNFQYHDMSATIVSADIQNFEAASNGSFDYYESYFNYKDYSNPDIQKEIYWNVYANPTQNLSFSMPNILTNFLKEEDAMSPTLSEFNSYNLSIYYNEDIEELEYIDLILNKSREQNLHETNFQIYYLNY